VYPEASSLKGEGTMLQDEAGDEDVDLMGDSCVVEIAEVFAIVVGVFSSKMGK